VGTKRDDSSLLPVSKDEYFSASYRSSCLTPHESFCRTSLLALLDMGRSIERIENPDYEDFFVGKRVARSLIDTTDRSSPCRKISPAEMSHS